MHHVPIDRLDQADARVVPVRDDVDEPVIDGDLDLDVRVFLGEPRQHPREYERNGGGGDADLHAS